MKRFFLTLLFLLFAAQAWPATYYFKQGATGTIASTGCANTSDSTRCPFSVIGSAAIAAGDILLIVDGTHTITAAINIDCNGTATNGTSVSPITLKSQTERQGRLTSAADINIMNLSNCSWWIVDGLRMELPGTHSAGGITLQISGGSNINVKRNLFNQTDWYHLWVNGGTAITIEENEFYSFGKAIQVSGDANIVRRNYAHGRGKSASSSQTGCYFIYPGSNNIFENNISESCGSGGNSSGGFSTQPEGTTSGNAFYGNISINDEFPLTIQLRDSSSINTVIQDFVAIGPTGGGVAFRSSVNTVASGISVFMSGNAENGINADEDFPAVGGTTQVTLRNSYVTGAATGVNFSSQDTYTAGHVHSIATFSNTTTYGGQATSNTNPIAPGSDLFGSCRVYVPDAATALKGTGFNGGDVGANILYAYENGILDTSKRLWNVSNGKWLFAGAIATGINDIAGDSLFDVETRLNVGAANGCAFPASYVGPSLQLQLSHGQFFLLTGATDTAWVKKGEPDANITTAPASKLNWNWKTQNTGAAFDLTPRTYVRYDGGAIVALTDSFVNAVKALGNGAQWGTVMSEGSPITQDRLPSAHPNVPCTYTRSGAGAPTLNLTTNTESECAQAIEFDVSAIIGKVYEFFVYTNEGVQVDGGPMTVTIGSYAGAGVR